MESELVPAEDIADEELRACIARIQDRLGIERDGIASVYFTGFEGSLFEGAVHMLTDYIIAERQFNRED